MLYLNGGSSKGNQPKFIINDYFYKEDSKGYESIAEVLVSELLAYIEGIEYIDYYLVKLEDDNGSILECCKSKIYNKEDESFVSIAKILKMCMSENSLRKYNGKALVDFVVDSVYKVTNVDIRSYLGVLSYLDAIILNEDRHFNNISLIERNGVYRVAPIFDNGLSLLSDTSQDYLMGRGIGVLIRKVKCRPFSSSFSKQVRYFDNKPLVIRIDEFYKKLKEVKCNLDLYIPFKQQEYLRAERVLLKRLKETEGVLWVKK